MNKNNTVVKDCLYLSLRATDAICTKRSPMWTNQQKATGRDWSFFDQADGPTATSFEGPSHGPGGTFAYDKQRGKKKATAKPEKNTKSPRPKKHMFQNLRISKNTHSTTKRDLPKTQRFKQETKKASVSCLVRSCSPVPWDNFAKKKSTLEGHGPTGPGVGTGAADGIWPWWAIFFYLAGSANKVQVDLR